MNYILKSLIVGYEIPEWGPLPNNQDDDYFNMTSNIVKLYPPVEAITSNIKISKLSRNYVFVYEFSYLYDSDNLDKISRNEIMMKFKLQVRSLMEDYLNKKGISYQKLNN